MLYISTSVLKLIQLTRPQARGAVKRIYLYVQQGFYILGIARQSILQHYVESIVMQ